MLNNLTNFFNLIKARMIKTTLENADLIATGTRDTSYGGSYKPTAITYSNLRNQIAASLPPSGVSAVTGTSPVVSSGGATPAISMPAATTAVSGHLTSTDWTAFNNKQAALVSGINIKSINSNSLLGSGDLIIASGIAGIHLPFGVASGNSYTNTIDSAASSNTMTISGTGLLGLSPFRPSVSWTASSFTINVTALTGGGNSGRLLIYAGSQDGTVTLLLNLTFNILAAGLTTINQTFTFVAGTTYWIGWNCNFFQGSQTMTACAAASMAPLMLQFPVTTPTYNFGYFNSSFTTGAPPATINLSTYTRTNINCVQIWMSAQ